MANFFHFRCPSCGKKLKISTDLRGKTLRCPCSQKIKIPLHDLPGLESLPSLDFPQRTAHNQISPPPNQHLELHHISWLGLGFWLCTGLVISVTSSLLVKIAHLLTM